MKSELVSHVLDMGFDHETVRNVVHLKIVQSGKYACLLLSCYRNES